MYADGFYADGYTDQPMSVKLHGDYKGTVVVAAGQELMLSDRPPPPDESVVPAANRVGWYAPNFIDGNGNPAVDYQTRYEYPTRKPLIAGPIYARAESELLPCSATSPVLAGSINTMSSSYGDRTPWLEKNSARGLVAGPKCNWLNFGELYSSIDSLGQNLRLWRDRQGGSLTNLPIRQSFIVNDTSKTPKGTRQRGQTLVDALRGVWGQTLVDALRGVWGQTLVDALRGVWGQTLVDALRRVWGQTLLKVFGVWMDFSGSLLANWWKRRPSAV